MNSIGPAILLSILAVTWKMQDPSGLRWQDLNDLEAGLEEFIGSYIENNLQNASNIKFNEFESEVINDNEVRVYFNYKFDHPTRDEELDITTLNIKGSTSLTKKLDDVSSYYWQMGEVEIFEESIIFLREQLVLAP